MRTQDNHAHADTRYNALDFIDFILLLKNVVETKLHGYISLNVHLPLEIQHPRVYPNLSRARRFIQFGELLKNIFDIRLYWENAPLLRYGSWDLKYGQTDWHLISFTINLCLDTGHLMLGARSTEEARMRIITILKKRGKQIKHLHLHENNFKTDQHQKPHRVINKQLLTLLKKNRTYIYEKS